MMNITRHDNQQASRAVRRQLEKESDRIDLVNAAYKTAMDEMSVLHAYGQSKALATLTVVDAMRKEGKAVVTMAPELATELDGLAALYTQYMTQVVSMSSERLIQLANEISCREIGR